MFLCSVLKIFNDSQLQKRPPFSPILSNNGPQNSLRYEIKLQASHSSVIHIHVHTHTLTHRHTNTTLLLNTIMTHTKTSGGKEKKRGGGREVGKLLALFRCCLIFLQKSAISLDVPRFFVGDTYLQVYM